MTTKLSIIELLFFALYIILPSYFAIEFSENLPLLTASRLILLVLLIVYLFRKRFDITLKFSKNKVISFALFAFFTISIFVNLFHFIKFPMDVLKEMITIFFEQFLVIFLVSKIVTNKIKLINCLKVIACVAGYLGFLSIFESLTKTNLFYYLNTVNREMLMASYNRIGLLRAELGFGHPVYYGAYCVVMIPIIMYLYENSKNKNFYMICLILNLVGLFLSNSRGSIFAALLLFLFVICIKHRKDLKKYLKFFAFFLVIFAFLMFIPQFNKFVTDFLTSLINVFLKDKVNIEGYGDNSNGLYSRLFQFSGIFAVLNINPLFGMGPDALKRGLVYFNYNGLWYISDTIDSEIVSIFCHYGILGFISFSILIVAIFSQMFKKKYKKDKLMNTFKLCFIAYLLCLLTITNREKIFFTLLGLFIAYLNILKSKERKKENV